MRNWNLIVRYRSWNRNRSNWTVRHGWILSSRYVRVLIIRQRSRSPGWYPPLRRNGTSLTLLPLESVERLLQDWLTAGTSLDFTTLQSFFYSFSHDHHVRKSCGHTTDQSFIILALQGSHENVNQFTINQRRVHPCSQFSPALCVFFKRFIVFLGHTLKLSTVWCHVSIIFVLLCECFSQLIPSVDVATFQLHVPVQRCPS